MTRGKGRKTSAPGTFGTVHKLPSGRYRAMYWGSDGRRHKAPTTFTAKAAARKWLSLRHSEIIRNAWEPPEADAPRPAPTTLTEYADQWLDRRDIKDRTREHYRTLLDRHIIPALGGLPVGSITRDDIADWYAALDRSTPTLRAHTYSLLKTILGGAVADGKAPANPCTIRGAGTVRRAHTPRPATLDELGVLAAAMPDRQRAMVLLAAWCALRFGELTELRRADVDLGEGVLRVRRGVVRTKRGFTVGMPKSQAGSRDVAVPPHLVPMLEDHLARHVGPQADSLLFPAVGGGHLAPDSLYRGYHKARSAAGRPDLRFHDLRHTGAVLAAATGATLAELMARLGHSTPAAAMRYQHAAQGADRRIAERLSALARPDGGRSA